MSEDKVISLHSVRGEYSDIREMMKDYQDSEYHRGILVLFNKQGEMLVHHSASNSQLAWAAADLLKRSVKEDLRQTIRINFMRGWVYPQGIPRKLPRLKHPLARAY